MSNKTLVEKIRGIIQEMRTANIDESSGITALESSIRALEAMPYSLIKVLDSLVLDLEIEIGYELEGLQSNSRQVLERIESALLDVLIEQSD